MQVLMPQLGETVAEGRITRWFKSIGETVEPGEILFEIETDKVSMEVPATGAGVIAEIRVSAGETAPVGAIVATLTDAGTSASPNSMAQMSAPMIAAKAETTASRTNRASSGTANRSVSGGRLPCSDPAIALQPLDPFHPIRTPDRNYGPARLPTGLTVTPLARRLADAAGVDLTRIAPSGPHGRIVARDVETAIEKTAEIKTSLSSVRISAAQQVTDLYEPGSYQELALDGMRRTIAARLVEAKQTVPHFYLTCEVALNRLEAVRKEANAVLCSGHIGSPVMKLSLNDFFIKALAVALIRIPAANAVFDENRILRFRSADIAVAVALDNGLITPVIRNAEAKTLTAISAEMRRLAARARDRQLTLAEYRGGVSTISNLGMYGVREFAGIINAPHSSLLAVGAAERRPVETEQGEVRFETKMTVTLSCDHRVIDGAIGAELLAAFKVLVENPVALAI